MAFTPKLTYKGKPLVRKDNELYYGRMTDPYVLYLQILTTTPVGDQQVADKVHLMLLSTDTTKAPQERVARQTTKHGLYNALDIGSIWLGSSPFRRTRTEHHDEKSWCFVLSGCRRQTLSKIEPSQALTRQLPRGGSFLSLRKMLIKLSLSGELASRSDD